MIFFKCDNVDVLTRLGRSVSRNYSDGNWEILIDSNDTNPYGNFWLKTKTILNNEDLNYSICELISNIKYWFKDEFDEYFKCKD